MRGPRREPFAACAAALVALVCLAAPGCSDHSQRDQRVHFERRIERRLAEMDTAVDSLYARFTRTGGSAHARAGRALRDLRNRQDDARQKFRELGRSSEGAWKDFRDRFEVAMRRLERSYQKARNLLESARRETARKRESSGADSTRAPS